MEWQNNRLDVAEDYLHGGYHHGGWNHHDDWHHYAEAAFAFTVGMTMTAIMVDALATPPPPSTTTVIVQQAGPPPCTMQPFPAGAATYYSCGTLWLQKVMMGGEMTYIVVGPPG